MPMFNEQEQLVIEENVDELQIFIDTQGPQITDVTINNLDADDYDLFDPKPSQTGPTPLIDSLTIHVRDLPSRVDQAVNINDFLYEAIKADIAGTAGNYLLVGDHVGIIPIQSITVNNETAADYTFNGTLTAVTSTSVITDGNLVGAAERPVVGDYILINNGAAAGQVRRIVAYSAATGQMTLDQPLLALPAAGNSYTITTFAEATIVLDFFTPLPDDRFTLTVSDNLVDPAGNKLDGESNADEPQEIPSFPSGDGVPGGSFIARFTVDSRPELGSHVAQDIDVDINGNFVWDPANGQIGNDATNVDLSFTLPVANADGSIGEGGYNVHDLLFAGKFLPLIGEGGEGAGGGPVGTPRYFDQLAAFGNSAELGGIFRWIIDTNSDGVVTLGTDVLTTQAAVVNGFSVAGAIPVAGNFDGNLANGDEIGLYNAGRWALDTNKNYMIDAADTFLNTTLLGAPIVGDFDGDGLDDLAVFNSNQFFFNLANDGFGDAADRTMIWGFPGVLDKPVAADMDQDGIDDIGLWVPRTSASLPQGVAEWYFLISNDPTGNLRVTGNINRLNHAFTPAPFGFDVFAEFGDERSLPIVGNFDPPVSASANQTITLAGDYDGSGVVDYADYQMWKSYFGTTDPACDGNGDGIVNAADYTIWRDNLGRVAGGAGSASAVSSGGSSSSSAGSAALTISDFGDEADEPSAALLASRNSVSTAFLVTAAPLPAVEAAPLIVAPTTAAAPAVETTAANSKSIGLAALFFSSPFSDALGSSESFVATTLGASVEDNSLLLSVVDEQSARIDDALEDFDADAAWDDELGDDSADDHEGSLALAWQAWDEI
jgi:hypothetical protein